MKTDAALDKNITIYTVSKLNREAKLTLEQQFSSVWIEGELSNVVRPSSSHLYFSLKDEFAQVRCAMFKNANRSLNFIPKDGMKVLLKADVSLYEGRGDFQLIVSFMEESGKGALQAAFLALKNKLTEEGLFFEQHKKPLPQFARCIGIISSASGAAVKDILTTLKRRFSATPVIIYPTAVQGASAGKEICHAIAIANKRQECDVLILARGGGSLEDLWSFNEEIVARAIFASQIPIITGVGHEIDFTIADFVADKRAATPTAAAELATPNQQELLQQLLQITTKLIRKIKDDLRQKQQQIDYLEKRLIDPRQRLTEKKQRLQLLYRALIQNQRHFLKHQRHEVITLTTTINKHNPTYSIQQIENQCQLLLQQLHYLMVQCLEKNQATLGKLAASLDAFSPLATLSRGYAIVTDDKGHVLKKASEVKPAATITAELGSGKLECTVMKVLP